MHAVVVNLVDQHLGRLGGPPLVTARSMMPKVSKKA